jgi:hypothetical protein
MRIFSKLVFICNLCFVVAVIFAKIEAVQKKTADYNGQLLPQPIISTLAVLGYSAIFINLLFLLVCCGLLIFKQIKQIPKWIVIVNLVFFIIQVFYFFL